MNEDDAVRKLSRLEMRKQKLMEYLAAKGKLKPPNSKPYLRDDTIKHKKPEGSCSKTSNADEGKENEGRQHQRLQLAEKPKPQPSAGATRPPLSSSANVLAARAPECPRLPAPGGACPAAPARAKPQPPRALPGPAAALRATKACSVAGPIRAGAQTVTSSRSGSRAATTGRTATESRSRLRPVPTAAASARTAPVASALARTVPAATAQARTRPSAATTQPGLLSAGPHPSTSALSKARGNTTAPARTRPSGSAPFKTRPRESAPAGTGRVTAAPPRTGPAAAAWSKPGPGKGPPARGPPAVRAPAPKAPAIPTEVSSKRRSAPGPPGTQTRCGALQKRAAGPAGRGGPVLRSAGSKPAERAQSLPAAAAASLSKPGAESARASARLAQPPSQPPRPGPKAAAPRGGRAGGRSLATAGRAGDAGEGQRVTALQRAVRQAMTEMRRGRRLAGSGGQGERKGDGPNAAPSTVPPSPVPRSARQSCQPLRPADLKTPARTGGAGPGLIGTAPPRDRKMTTAQEERMQKLQEWRRSKGISYKRPPMPVRPRTKKMAATPQHYWTAMEEEEEAQSLVYNIDRSLTDCVKLLQEGCSSEQVQEVLSRVPMAQKFAKYWICRARLMEREGELEVLPLFEEAVRVVMEPVDELRVVVFEILKKKEEMSAEGVEGSPSASEGEGKKGNEEEEEDDEEEEAQQPAAVDPVTPRATSALICGAKGGSSVVKYKITATPGGRRSQSQEPVTLDGQELRFFTPVRRSVRIERSAPRYPAALREHDPCVASFRDLLAEEEDEGRGEEEHGSPLYVYRENEALRDQVQIQLQYPSGPGV